MLYQLQILYFMKRRILFTKVFGHKNLFPMLKIIESSIEFFEEISLREILLISLPISNDIEIITDMYIDRGEFKGFENKVRGFLRSKFSNVTIVKQDINMRFNGNLSSNNYYLTDKNAPVIIQDFFIQNYEDRYNATIDFGYSNGAIQYTFKNLFVEKKIGYQKEGPIYIDFYMKSIINFFNPFD